MEHWYDTDTNTDKVGGGGGVKARLIVAGHTGDVT
jgi:hypothetical protein